MMMKKRTTWLTITGVLALGILIGTIMTGPAGAFGPGGGPSGQSGMGGFDSAEDGEAFHEELGFDGEAGPGRMMGLSEEELEAFYEERGSEGTRFHRGGGMMRGFDSEEDWGAFHENRGFGNGMMHGRGMMGGWTEEQRDEMIQFMEDHAGNMPCGRSFNGETDWDDRAEQDDK